MNEDVLIKQCINNNKEAQRKLFDSYYRLCYNISYRYVTNHYDAEDVVSEIFIRVFRNLDKYKSQQRNGLRNWIYSIAVNESLRFLKKKQPLVFVEDPVEPNINEWDDTKGPPIDMKILEAAIGELPAGYRTVFLLNVVEGYSHAEIAEHLSISRNTSKSQILKARKLLKTKIQSYVSKQTR